MYILIYTQELLIGKRRYIANAELQIYLIYKAVIRVENIFIFEEKRLFFSISTLLAHKKNPTEKGEKKLLL